MARDSSGFSFWRFWFKTSWSAVSSGLLWDLGCVGTDPGSKINQNSLCHARTHFSHAALGHADKAALGGQLGWAGKEMGPPSQAGKGAHAKGWQTPALSMLSVWSNAHLQDTAAVCTPFFHVWFSPSSAPTSAAQNAPYQTGGKTAPAGSHVSGFKQEIQPGRNRIRNQLSSPGPGGQSQRLPPQPGIPLAAAAPQQPWGCAWSGHPPGEQEVAAWFIPTTKVSKWGFFPPFQKVQTTTLSHNATASCSAWQSGSVLPQGTGLQLPPKIIERWGLPLGSFPGSLDTQHLLVPEILLLQLNFARSARPPFPLSLHLTIAHTAAKLFQCFPNQYVMCTHSTFGDPGH